jgi:hypothetical protein
VEPEVITANNFMFKGTGGHLSRFSVESKNLIQGIDMRLGEVSKEPSARTIAQMNGIGKDVFFIQDDII